MSKIDYYKSVWGMKAPQVQKICRQHERALKHLDQQEEMVRNLEDELEVAAWWTPVDAEYQEMLKEASIRNYRKALDKLE